MLLADYGLRTVLSSLSLASSLFKPTLNHGAEAVTPSLGTLDVSGSTIQHTLCISLLDGLVANCENSSPAAPVAMAVVTPPVSNATSHSSKTALISGSNAGSIFEVQDASCTVEPYDIPILSNVAFPPFDETRANIYRYRQQQGVNLGSW
jgi:hypothetical protein